ncbi:hypothetical protein C2E20_3848 [Micractinium conductrix]|uniref:Uncharacterized protein n=1 Tax=Micractinium conductrix TaxID=554055 RepID=A0A2P6VEW3_9CHLO|nr:hypothetical protein C2E20_3848 [Micractinium conductrix]|eukprot:PSC72633.1 hypothetical protein C2E20_3848 [Micractinium conductrix]
MGQCMSAVNTIQTLTTAQDGNQDIVLTRNDYELVIRSSKDLEYILEAYLGAQGKGLHEKCSSVQQYLTPALVKKIRYLATIRNKLVHERQFHHIPDRPRFVENYQIAERELQQVVARHGRRPASGQSDDVCRMM